MILIRKGKEPASLTRYRKTTFAYYDGCNKADIRENLLREQGYLCAYCMRRITAENTRIEHWKPEVSLSEAEKLDYSNMLAVCFGNAGAVLEKDLTCDAKKKDTKITVDPRNPEHISALAYRKGTGEIFSTNENINEDVTSTLNLNCSKQNLPANRLATLKRVVRELGKRKREGSWKATDLRRLLQLYETPDAEGRKKEYAGIVIWYLSKRLH